MRSTYARVVMLYGWICAGVLSCAATARSLCQACQHALAHSPPPTTPSVHLLRPHALPKHAHASAKYLACAHRHAHTHAHTDTRAHTTSSHARVVLQQEGVRGVRGRCQRKQARGGGDHGQQRAPAAPAHGVRQSRRAAGTPAPAGAARLAITLPLQRRGMRRVRRHAGGARQTRARHRAGAGRSRRSLVPSRLLPSHRTCRVSPPRTCV